MAGINVSCFHRDKIRDQFVSRIHGLLEEGNNDIVELLLKQGISFEMLKDISPTSKDENVLVSEEVVRES